MWLALKSISLVDRPHVILRHASLHPTKTIRVLIFINARSTTNWGPVKVVTLLFKGKDLVLREDTK